MTYPSQSVFGSMMGIVFTHAAYNVNGQLRERHTGRASTTVCWAFSWEPGWNRLSQEQAEPLPKIINLSGSGIGLANHHLTDTVLQGMRPGSNKNRPRGFIDGLARPC